MPLITISQWIGCEGLDIARLVAESLQIELFDDYRLQQMAHEMGIRDEDIPDMDKGAPGLFDRIFTKKPEIYMDYIEVIVYEAAKKGEGVIIGHGSQVLLPEFGCGFHVMIHAEESTRIQNLMLQKKLSRDAAEKLVKKSDQEQMHFFRYAFHREWTDFSLYDLIISTEHITPDLAAKLIVDVQGSERMESCKLQARETMEKLSLNREIKAALLSNNIKIKWLEIEVPEKGFVKIGGFIYSEDEKEKALKIIRALPAVSNISEDIMVLSHFS